MTSMPTDGADFGRTRPCYGKAYVMAKEGADDQAVAHCVMRGLEIDIRREGGVPGFVALADLITKFAQTGGSAKDVMIGLEGVRRGIVDSPLSRHLVHAAIQMGMRVIREFKNMSRQRVAEGILLRMAESRCCDGMHGYLSRHRTGDPSQSADIVASIKSKLGDSPQAPDLARRMLNGSAKGLPAKAAKQAVVSHTAEDLNNEEL